MHSIKIPIYILTLLLLFNTSCKPKEPTFTSKEHKFIYDTFVKTLDVEAKCNVTLTKVKDKERVYELDVWCDASDKYSVEYKILDYRDFNEDGIPDYLIDLVSSGPLGGSPESYSYYLYYIMNENNTIMQEHSILRYAAFSYNTVDLISYEEGILQAEATQNFRSFYKEGNQIESYYDATIPLSFYFRNGKILEKSYEEQCSLAKMKNKNIFKGTTPKVKRLTSIDADNYTQFQKEKIKSENRSVTAELSGCDNFYLRFVIDQECKENWDKESFLYEKTALEELDFLIENTRFKTKIRQAKNAIVNDALEAIEWNTKKTAISLEGSDFSVYSSFDAKDNTYRVVVDLKEETNTLQTHNWDISSRLNESNSQPIEEEWD